MKEFITRDETAKIKMVDQIESDHPPIETLQEEETKSAVAIPMSASSPDMPIGANCKREFHALRSSGRRSLNVINRVIIHCTQGATARAAASWFTNPSCQGSAHLCLDDIECYRTLDDDEIPWGAPGANYTGFHIEQAGFVSWSEAVWSKTHRKTIKRCAYKTAYHCKKYGIPVKWLTVNDLKAGKAGISDHHSCTLAFGGSHTDPGPNYPRSLFMGMVRTYYAAMKVKRVA